MSLCAPSWHVWTTSHEVLEQEESPKHVDNEQKSVRKDSKDLELFCPTDTPGYLCILFASQLPCFQPVTPTIPPDLAAASNRLASLWILKMIDQKRNKWSRHSQTTTIHACDRHTESCIVLSIHQPYAFIAAACGVLYLRRLCCETSGSFTGDCDPRRFNYDDEFIDGGDSTR